MCEACVGGGFAPGLVCSRALSRGEKGALVGRRRGAGVLLGVMVVVVVCYKIRK